MPRSFITSVFAVALTMAGVAQQPPPPAGQAAGTSGTAPATAPQGGSGGRDGAAGEPARGQNPAAPAAPTTPAKPLVPVAASTLAMHPEAFYGESVSVTATVEQLLSQFAFSVDQGKTRSNGRDVLIVAPTLQSPVDANTYVTVLGEVVKFDPAEISKKAKDYKNDLAPDVAAKYAGRPTIIATSVINASGLDIAKRQPPPMSAEELDYQKVMRQVGPANTALRGALDKSDQSATKEQAEILTKAFTQTEAFWKSRGKPDALKWAADAHAMADSIDKAVAAGKWDDAKASAGTLGQQCTSCHGAYRERFDDGSFRIKSGGK